MSHTMRQDVLGACMDREGPVSLTWHPLSTYRIFRYCFTMTYRRKALIKPRGFTGCVVKPQLALVTQSDPSGDQVEGLIIADSVRHITPTFQFFIVWLKYNEGIVNILILLHRYMPGLYLGCSVQDNVYNTLQIQTE